MIFAFLPKLGYILLMTQIETVQNVTIIPGDEIKLGARYEAGAEKNFADNFIHIKSLDTLLDENVTTYGPSYPSGKFQSISDYKNALRGTPLERHGIETIDEWLLIARQRYIDRNASADMKDALQFRVALHTYRTAYENDFERLKVTAMEGFTSVLGIRNAEQFTKTFFPQPKVARDHPPHKEIMRSEKGDKISATVSRNQHGQIVYVVPGSAKWIEEEIQEEATKITEVLTPLNGKTNLAPTSEVQEESHPKRLSRRHRHNR